MMKDFIPVAGEQTNGIEQQAYYAQLLIKAFQDALDKNNCLTKVPVAIGLEISSALDDLHDIKDIVAGIGGVDNQLASPDPDRQIVVVSPNDDFDYSQSSSAPIQADYGVNKKNYIADLKQFAEDCFDCDLDMDVIGAFKNLINALKGQIDFLKNKLKGLKDLLDFDLSANFDGLMDIADIFSNMCIKDLNMISALLLQSLLDFNADINIGGIGDYQFSFGVMQSIMSVVFNGIRDILNYAMKPVNCAVTALETIASAIPSEREISKRLGESKTNKLFELTGVDLASAPPSKYGSKVNDIISKIRTQQSEISQSVFEASKTTEGMIRQTNDAIQKSLESVDKKYQDLIGISKYMQCEEMRSGPTRGGVEGGLPSITSDIKLMSGLVNLIRQIIKKKVGKKIREREFNSSVSTFTPIQTQPFEISHVDIADAIAESFDATARVTNTSEGNIAVIFTKKPGTNTQSKLGLKICNTEDFIKKNHIQEIIKEVIDEIQQEKATTGTGPSTSGTNRPSVPIKPVPSDETQISKVTADKNAVLVIPEYSELIKSTFNILKSKTDSPSVDAKSIQKSTVIKCSTNEEILARLSLAKS